MELRQVAIVQIRHLEFVTQICQNSKQSQTKMRIFVFFFSFLNQVSDFIALKNA